MHQVNHFVLLMQIMEVDEAMPCNEFLDGDDLTTWSENNGFMVIETVCQGDCGLDTMAAYLGMPRRPASWLALRRELQEYVNRVCANPLWLAGFQMAGETDLVLGNVVVTNKT